MKVIFDIETTGLNYDEDEILQFSAINENGEVLLNTYVKPECHESWPNASKINGITPEVVKDAPTFTEIINDIQDIFNSADELIAYNGEFDKTFLQRQGIVISNDTPYFDVMLEFAPIYGEWNDYFGEYKWQKLITCAKYYGYKYNAHDSLEDVKATLFAYNKIKESL